MNEDHYRRAERALWAAQGMTPAERFITLQRTDTSIRVQEVGAGPPVVFVHGASNGGTSWASLASRLSDFRCILIDRPGCGLSPRLRTGFADMGSLDAFADDLVVDVLDAIEVTQRPCRRDVDGRLLRHQDRRGAPRPGRPARDVELELRRAGSDGAARDAHREPTRARAARV